MDTNFVLPFLTHARPEAVLVFNLALCAGALFLGRSKNGTPDEKFSAWFLGVMWGAALVFVQYKASRYEEGGGWILPSDAFVDLRFICVGILTAGAAGLATRLALVGKEPTAPAIYLGLSLVFSVLFAHGLETHTVALASEAAKTCGATVFVVGFFTRLLCRTPAPVEQREPSRL